MWLEVTILEPDDEGNVKPNGAVNQVILNSAHLWGVEPVDSTDGKQGCKLFTTVGVGFTIRDSYESMWKRLSGAS